MSAPAVGSIIADRISSVNSEYRKIVSDIGAKANPIVKFVPESLLGSHNAGGGKKGILGKSGKKPRKVTG